MLNTILAYIHWDVSPAILKIGSFELRWYGLLFASAFYAGYLILTRIFKIEGLKQEVLDNLTLYMIVGTVIGARLGHVFFYEADYYLSNPEEILMIWKGGLASHGAAIGIILSVFIFSKTKIDRSFWWVIDRIVITVASAGIFIRLGNLMNSEIVGKPTDLPWGFVFERLGEDFARHPAQIYEAVAYGLIFLLLLTVYNKKKQNLEKGTLFGLFLITVFTARFIIEFTKAVQVSFEQDMALNMGQYLSIPFVLLGIVILILSRTNKLPG